MNYPSWIKEGSFVFAARTWQRPPDFVMSYLPLVHWFCSLRWHVWQGNVAGKGGNSSCTPRL